MSGKEIVSEWLREIPEESTLEDVIDALAIRAELQLAQAEIEAGLLIDQADVERESATWGMK